MTEKEWVEEVLRTLKQGLHMRRIRVDTGLRLPYGYEISAYRNKPDAKPISFQTDLAIVEEIDDDSWLPRVIVEAKIGSITTHDAITYSQKAEAHRTVHPYLRYGIMLGNRGHNPLPGRLYRHGTGFDFMVSFKGFELSTPELRSFLRIIRDEVRASRKLEKILYESRLSGRDHYTIFRRRLELKNI